MKIVLLAACLTFTVSSQAWVSPQTSPDNSPHSMQQDSQPPSLASSMSRGETKLTGCIKSKNDKYLLESEHRKPIWLSGSTDFAAHTGHLVTLYGQFLNGAPAAGTPQSGAAAANTSTRQDTDFQVKKLEMVSDTCVLKGQKVKQTSPPNQPQ